MKQHPLKVERELRGWSQAKVAEALNTTVRTVSRWEQGQALPYPYYRERLCELFGKDARQLGLLPDREEVEPVTSPSSEDSLASQLSSQATSPLSPSDATETGSSLVAGGGSQAVGTGPLINPHVVFGQAAYRLYDPTLPEALGSARDLVGREHVLRWTKQHLFEKGRLAIYGLPGIGKTALSVGLATDPQAQARFQDGVLWAGLGPQPDILGLLVRWGKLLGITPSEVENAGRSSGLPLLEDWRRALRATIGQRSFLLVIDDAWSINDALALEVGGPQCAYLLTTRQPQVAFAFAPERTFNIHELAEADGLAVLARFVPQLVQQEVEEARTLVNEVGSLPLALVLMGKYLATHFLPGQPHRIQRALAQLHQAMQRLLKNSSDKSVPNFALDVPLALHAAIAISDQRLTPPAHEALCALSVFPAKPDSFTEEAALAVTGEPVEILDELWDAGLLEGSGPGRYCLHRTIVNYAQAQGENSAAQQRLVHYMVAYVHEHQQDYEMLDREANIIWAAIDAARRLEMWSDLVRGAVALVSFMHVRGLYSQANVLLRQTLHATLQLEDLLARTIVLYHLADFADLLGDYPRVETYTQQGLELARRLGQQDLESGFLHLLGNMWSKRGDYTQAKRLFEDGLRLARPLNNLERICHLLNGLGTVLYHQGDFSQSGTYYAEALALARQTESQELVSRQLASLSVLEQEQGNYAQAEAYCQEGIRLAWQVGYQEQLCFHLNMLGLIAVQQRAYTQAEAYYQEALAQARRIGHRAHICTLLMHLGELSALRGDYVHAERYCQEGVELARQIGLRDSQAVLLLHLGYAVGLQEGTYQRASACFQECLEVMQQLRRASSDHKTSEQLPMPSLPTSRISRLINTLSIFWGEIHLKYQHLDAATAAFNAVLQSIDESGQAQGAVPTEQDLAQSEMGQAQGQMSAGRELDQAEVGQGPVMSADGTILTGRELAQPETGPLEGPVPTEQNLGLRALAQYGLARIAALHGTLSEAHRLGEECSATLARLGHWKAREVRHWLASIAASEPIV